MEPFDYRLSRSEFLKKAVRNKSVLPFVYCYPLRTAYTRFESPTNLQDVWIADSLHNPDLNIYIHIPFCAYKCSFCNLFTVTTSTTEPDLFKAYIEMVQQDLRKLAPSLIGRKVRSVYFGGGTPFVVGIELLVSLLESLADVFPDFPASAEEVTVEATPDAVVGEKDRLATLITAGVNRVSIGAQSLNDWELLKAGRGRARSSVILEAIGLLRSAGVSNIDVDMIVGLEGQTDVSLVQSIDALLETLPETISVYPISPRRGTRLVRGRSSFATPDVTVVERLKAVSERLRYAGYVRDTSIQYKLPGKGGFLQKRLYFKGVSVLGLGVGARSYTATVDYLTGGGASSNRAVLAAYLQNGGMKPISGIRITSDEAERRSLILGLLDMHIDGIPRAQDGSWKEPYRAVLKTALDLGLLEEVDARLSPTELGYLHRDAMCWALFSAKVLRRHAFNGKDYLDSQRFLSVDQLEIS